GDACGHGGLSTRHRSVAVVRVGARNGRRAPAARPACWSERDQNSVSPARRWLVPADDPPPAAVLPLEPLAELPLLPAVLPLAPLAELPLAPVGPRAPLAELPLLPAAVLPLLPLAALPLAPVGSLAPLAELPLLPAAVLPLL